MKNLSQQAKILSEALPYFQKFQGKRMVIKIGGSVLAEENIDQDLLKDVVLMKLVGMNPIIVHGGGNHISKVMARFKKESTFIDGLRVTDKETLEITQMVLEGIVNQKIVSLIQHFGGKAVGLSGQDGGMIIAKKLKDQKRDLGYVGEIVRINQALISHLEISGHIPVISPLGIDEKYQEHFNINADTVATALAIAIEAEKLIFISDQLGVYRDFQDPTSLISELKISEIKTMKENKTIYQGMLPKLESAKRAIENNIKSVHLISGKIENALLMELFTDGGIGTKISL